MSKAIADAAIESLLPQVPLGEFSGELQFRLLTEEVVPLEPAGSFWLEDRLLVVAIAVGVLLGAVSGGAIKFR